MNDKIYQRFFKNNKKLNLSYIVSIDNSEIFDILENDEKKYVKNPLTELIQNYDDIKEILNNDNINRLEYIYINKQKVHKILYEEEKYIYIETNMINNFSDYYYLYALINEQPDLINYTYDFELIQKLYNELIESKNEIKEIILAKMLITYIDYSDFDENDNNIELCSDIEKKCITNIINSKKSVLYKYKIDLKIANLEDKDIYIEDIYSDIIKTLIINQKLEKSEETEKLLEEIEVKNIRLNKKIFEGLKQVLVGKNIEKYEIKNFEDILNENKLSFYYMLFKYILKNSIYIYYIPFLLQTQKQITLLINNNLKEFYNINKDIFRLFETLSYFIDLNYYHKKYTYYKMFIYKNPQNSNNKNNINLTNEDNEENLKEKSFYGDDSSYVSAFENSSFISKSNLELSQLSEEPILYVQKEKAFQIMRSSNFVFKVKYNKEKEETKVEYKSISYKDDKDNIKFITIEEIKNGISSTEEIKLFYYKFIKFLEKVENEFRLYYKNEKQYEIIMKFTNKYNNNDLNIDCDYIFNEDGIKKTEFNEHNLLDTSNYVGLTCLINYLNCC